MKQTNKLRKVLGMLPWQMERKKKEEKDLLWAKILSEFLADAPVADLVKLSSAASIVAKESYPNFKCHRTQKYIDIVYTYFYIKQSSTSRVASVIQLKIDAAVAGLDKSDLLKIASTESLEVMSYLLKLGCVEGREFSRSDEKGRELLLGIELGL